MQNMYARTRSLEMTARGATLVAQQKRASSGTLSALADNIPYPMITEETGLTPPSSIRHLTGSIQPAFLADLLFPDQRFWLIYKVLEQL